ncbi:hypothetical protein MHK_009647 [Candidatus Magnetomorum sp. HK-1]|nr:hypothetical protein MHK_009647 [Candidatus Magnetomorum sp. HK-1]
MKDVYFLGGHDAEMLEIKNMLIDNKVDYFDKKLRWGAKLSEYKEELNQLSNDQCPVFIELKLDCPYPERAFIIDHHDSRAGKDQLTSIEQTAKRLNVTMNRHQQLISINDKSHIRGMKAFGASESEIANIRALDRKAQGATPAEEEKAIKTIQENIKILCKGVALVKSLCERTSCVVDRIHDHYTHLIVYSPDGNMHYFGPGKIVFAIRDIILKAQKKDPKIEVWYGGSLPDFGFLGSTMKMSETDLSKFFCTMN